MSPKFLRSVGPAVLLLVTMLSLAPPANSLLPSASAVPTSSARPGAGGRAGTVAPGATLDLSSQSTWVSTSDPTFSLQVTFAVPGERRSTLELAVTVYDRLRTRTAFTQALDGSATGDVLDQVAPVSVTGSSSSQALSMRVETGPVVSGTTGSTIDLGCATSGPCGGVYPVVVSLRQGSSGTVLARLDTFLTYVDATSGDPLRFAMVLPVASPVRVHEAERNPSKVLATPSASEIGRLGDLVHAVASQPAAATTLLVDPHTVQGLMGAGAAGRRAVAALGTLSSSASIEIPSASYVPVDLAALAGAGLTGEITYQMEIGSATMSQAGIRTDGAASTWVAGADMTQSLAGGLADAGLDRVIVPSDVLASSSDRLGITQPFALATGHGATVTAAASDAGLDAHFAPTNDPVLAAEQLLADLAFIEYEEPFASATRGVVAVAPSSPPSSRFIDTVLDGLVQNPNVRAVTLDQFFDEVPSGGNGAPTIRQAAVDAAPGFARPLAQGISMARQRNDAFHSAVNGSPPVLDQLDDVLLASESDDLSGAHQLATVQTYEAVLGAQLAQVQLSTVRTITLTSRTGRIPITFLSSAPYTLVGDVVLTSDKFTFPSGSTLTNFRISRSTNPVAMEVEARTSGDLPLRITLVAPRTDPGAAPLVIARGQLTIRSTATSLVGVLLTLLAITVLLAWWARTWRQGRRRAANRGRDPTAPLRRSAS